MNVAWWPHTSNPVVASYRLRCKQIVEQLKRDGHDVGRYAPRMRPTTLVLSKRYDPRSIATAAELRERHGTRLVLDLCDNHFYATQASPYWEKRAESLRAAISTVDLVVASTPTLAEVIRNETGHQDIVVIGDAVEPPYMPSADERIRHPLAELDLSRLHSALQRDGLTPGHRLVWFGSHGSGNAEGGMSDLLRLRTQLEQLHRNHPLSLTVISNSYKLYRQIMAPWAIPTHYLRWRGETFSRALRLHGLTVIPVTRNPFTLCKSNNRALTSLRHGLCVLADSIPSYTELGDCVELDNWEDGLIRLQEEEAYRQRQLAAGKKKLATTYSLEQIAAQWATALGLTAGRAMAGPSTTSKVIT